MQHQIAALVLGDFAGFAGVKMVLAGGARHQLAGLGLFNPLGGSFVGFNFGHKKY